MPLLPAVLSSALTKQLLRTSARQHIFKTLTVQCSAPAQWLRMVYCGIPLVLHFPYSRCKVSLIRILSLLCGDHLRNSVQQCEYLADTICSVPEARYRRGNLAVWWCISAHVANSVDLVPLGSGSAGEKPVQSGKRAEELSCSCSLEYLVFVSAMSIYNTTSVSDRHETPRVTVSPHL